MDAIRVVVFLVSCAENLLYCDDISNAHLHFSDMEDCHSNLSEIIRQAETLAPDRAVVMGKCRYILMDPKRTYEASIW